VELVFAPLSDVLPVVRPDVCALTFDLSILPSTFIVGVIGPGLDSTASLASSLERAFISTSIRHSFDTFTVLHVVLPVSGVDLAIMVHVLAFTISFTSLEFTQKDVLVSVIESSTAFSMILDPLANILSAIGPNLDAKAMLNMGTFLHLSGVNAAVSELQVKVCDQLFVITGLLTGFNYVLDVDEVFLICQGRRLLR
jgi:hypothetical protein